MSLLDNYIVVVIHSLGFRRFIQILTNYLLMLYLFKQYSWKYKKSIQL